jgi:hypothetical protein
MSLLVALAVGGIVLLVLALAPLLLLGGIFMLLVQLLLLPLKLLGFGLRLGAGLVAGVLKLFLVLVGGALLILFGLGMVPLIPLLVVGAGLYLVLRPPAVRPRPSA